MGQPELYQDSRFDENYKRGKLNRLELIDIVNEWSRGFTSEELQAKFDEASIPAARYNELPEVWEDPQVQHRGLRATTPHPWSATGSVDLIASPLANMSESPATIRRAPPLLGEHTAEVLGELGYDNARIAQLQEMKIL